MEGRALSVTLLALLALTAQVSASELRGSRQLLQKSCPELTKSALNAFNKDAGTSFRAECLKDGDVVKSCGSASKGVCIKSRGVYCLYAPKSYCKPTESEVLALFDKWNDALKTLDPEVVADLYAEDAVLLPTLSNQVRNTRALIVDYFVHFLANKPVGALDSYNVRYPADGVVDLMGIYTFTLDGGRKVQARYSYQFKNVKGKWLIAEHHSSAMPESVEQEVLNAFSEWDAALATKDPERVADMYAPGATLIPTLSNKVRTNRADIVDYFVHFLANSPRGTLDHGASGPTVTILGPGAAVNSGTYVFDLTDPTTGVSRKVQARYTFVYVKYGSKWMIVQHHSSGMPEPVATPAPQ